VRLHRPYQTSGRNLPRLRQSYLLEKVTKDGTFLICPNSKAPAKPKTAAKSAKSAKAAKTKTKPAAVPAVEPGSCDFSKKIAEPNRGRAHRRLALE